MKSLRVVKVKKQAHYFKYFDKVWKATNKKLTDQCYIQQVGKAAFHERGHANLETPTKFVNPKK